MAGIGTAARNWEEELKKQQQGIGTAAYHEPAGSIGTPAANQGIGTPAYHVPAGSIGTPASRDGTMRPEDPRLGGASPQQIQPMQGVTAGTQQKLNRLEQGYQPGQQAQDASAALQQLIAQKPQGYTSKWGGQLEGILQQLQGSKFNYDLNGDAFFQSMKDNQVQLAKQASMDVMGRAAGLTGGYGNSAAQSAAHQAYQQGLMNLNDKALDAYSLAMQKFQMEQQGLKDQFGMVGQMEAQDYDRYRDQMGDFNAERDYLTGRYDTETERGRDQYNRDLNYYLQRAQIENADYRNEQERQEAIRQFEMQYAADQDRFNWQKDVDQRDYDRGVLESDRNYALNQQQMAEQIRQFNESLDWDKMSSQQKYAADYALAILQNGQMPSEELLTAAGLSAEDAQKLMAKIASGGGYTPKKTTTGGMTVLDAMERDYILDPKNAAQILQYSKDANAKYVNDTLNKGQLPSANAVQNAGMNQTDVMKQFMQGRAPQGLTPEELLRRKLGI